MNAQNQKVEPFIICIYKTIFNLIRKLGQELEKVIQNITIEKLFQQRLNLCVPCGKTLSFGATWWEMLDVFDTLDYLPNLGEWIPKL